MSKTVHESWNLQSPRYVEYADSIKEQEEQEKRRELNASKIVLSFSACEHAACVDVGVWSWVFVFFFWF